MHNERVVAPGRKQIQSRARPTKSGSGLKTAAPRESGKGSGSPMPVLTQPGMSAVVARISAMALTSFSSTSAAVSTCIW